MRFQQHHFFWLMYGAYAQFEQDFPRSVHANNDQEYIQLIFFNNGRSFCKMILRYACGEERSKRPQASIVIFLVDLRAASPKVMNYARYPRKTTTIKNGIKKVIDLQRIFTTESKTVIA